MIKTLLTKRRKFVV